MKSVHQKEKVCAVGSGKCDVTFAAGFVCVKILPVTAASLVFEMESLPLRLVTMKVGDQYSNCLCNKYIAF